MRFQALVYKADDARESTLLDFEADTDREAWDYITANKPSDYRISYYGPVSESVYRGPKASS